MKLIFICSLVCLFSACDHADKQIIAHPIEPALPEQAVPEVKYDPAVVLSEGKDLFQKGQFAEARQKFEVIQANFPSSTQMAEAEPMLKLSIEEGKWQSALSSEDPSLSQAYIDEYPKGKYSLKAKGRIKELIKKKEKDDYEYALSQNSSGVWKAFLENYPNRTDKKDIKKRIIRAEVDEIMRDERTGEIPSSSRVGYGNSSTSTVSIKNDTSCELIVRYSGIDAKEIIIPVGATRSVSLSSGNYKIAASACGLHYAGTESLSGSYSSSYYIVTSYR